MASPPSATSLLLAIAIAGLLVAPRSAGARTIAGEAFLCVAARSARAPHGAVPFPTFHPRIGVPVVDRFSRPLAEEHHTLDLRKPEAWCRPVRLDDTELIDELHGFEVYDARRTRRQPAAPPFVPVDDEIVGTFGAVQLRVTALAALAVPTTATGAVGGTDPNLDQYWAYGFFDGANYLRLDRVQFVASDPTIAAGGSPYVQGKAPGTVTISAAWWPSHPKP